MDLRYSDIDEDFRSRLREWLAEEVPQHGAPPAPGDWLARRQYDTSWQRKLFDAGYAGLGWPAEYGGAGAPLSQQLIYYEETAAAGAPPLNACYVGLMHGGPTLIMEGTEDQKRRHLPGILRGDEVWCQGFSEPQAGSDLASLRTRAVRQGDEYVIHGQKIWSTRAHIADYCELLVRTDPSQTKHGGITWLILPMDQPGVDIRPIRTVEGDSDFCELFLEGARVPVENRVGEENDGWRVANVTLRFERGTSFAPHIVELATQLRRIVEVAVDRGDAWGDSSFRRRVGALSGEIEGLRRLTQMCVSEAAASGAPSLVGSAIKLRYSELYQEIGELGMQLLGRDAFRTVDAPGLPISEMKHDYFWSLQFTISGGTSQIQRNIIGERILGQAKEPRA
jgi:alkylation response protein AidB-like acyl-CoA dehydrogenase